MERQYLSPKLFVAAILALYIAALCCFGFGCYQRLLAVSASCLISLRSNFIAASRFGFGLSFRAAVGWRFLLSIGCFDI
jgi:hypothetical protein